MLLAVFGVLTVLVAIVAGSLWWTAVGIACVAWPTRQRLKSRPRLSAGVVVAVLGLAWWNGRAAEAKKQAELALAAEEAQAESARKAEEHAARKVAVLDGLPSKIAAMQSELDAAWTKLHSTRGNPDAPLSSALEAFQSIRTRAGDMVDVLGAGADQDLESLASRAETALRATKAVQSARDTSSAQMIAEARRLIREEEWSTAVMLCDRFLSADKALKGAIKDVRDLKLASFLPSQQESKQRYVECSSLKKRAEKLEARRSAEVEREQQRAAGVNSKCGDAPQVSEWDGELVGLELTLEDSAHDPDSIDVSDCTRPLLYEDLCWVSTCNVRGKNAFGAKVLNRIKYSYRQGVFIPLD